MNKKIKILIVIFLIVVHVGCNYNPKIEIINDEVYIGEENGVITLTELDKIYEIYNRGFGGDKLFMYLCNNNIKKYKSLVYDEEIIYTCIKVENVGVLYVYVGGNESDYRVVYLVFKENNPLCKSDEFDFLTMKESSIKDVSNIDKYLKYNTLYTSFTGTITMHFTSDNKIVRISYLNNDSDIISNIECLDKENSITLIKGINNIDWH